MLNLGTRPISILIGFLVLLLSKEMAVAAEQNSPTKVIISASSEQAEADYTLGGADLIAIRVPHIEEFKELVVRIGGDGKVNLPLIGTMQAAGFTVRDFESRLATSLGEYVRDPHVSVLVMELRSQPVSVLGAVQHPGVLQVQGQKTLTEVLASAGGLTQEAGSKIRITRRTSSPNLPLPNAVVDPNGQYVTATVDLKQVTTGSDPIIQAHDVISVPRAQMVYVIGEVQRAGAIALQDHDSISVLQAVATVSGMTRVAATSRARILRSTQGTSERREIPVNVKRILAGKSPDIPLLQDDILFIPGNITKQVALKTVELGMGTASGLIVYRH